MAGGRISHALSVYSCQLHQSKEVKVIFEFLKNGYHEVGSSLDLYFEDDSIADEKIPFLAHLSSVLKENSFFPYDPPAGSRHLCHLIAGFLRTYRHVPLSTGASCDRTSLSFQQGLLLVRRHSSFSFLNLQSFERSSKGVRGSMNI